MGCIDSTIQTVELYSRLNEITKQAFRNAIAEDDLPALATLDAQSNYPVAIQLSETGLLWTTLHFCCRFESPKCLEYYLRKCYLFEPNEYLKFVNHQTIQGNSCLHLCAIWNAKKCFALLVRYGGLNLDLKNKSQKGILSTARDYSRKKMTKTLNALHNLYHQVMPWNFELLQEPINYEALSQKSFYDQVIKGILKKRDEHKQKKIQIQQPSNQQIQLKELKLKVQKERQDMYHKRLQILHEKIEKETETQEKVKEGENHEGPNSRQNEKDKKSKEEIQVERLFKQKQQQLQNIKKAINLLKMQSAYKKLRDEQERAYKGRMSQKKISEVFIQFRSHLLKMNAQAGHSKANDHLRVEDNVKQDEMLNAGNYLTVSNAMISKVPSQMLSVSNISCCYTPPDLNQLKQLPLSIQKKYLKAQKEGSFMDRQFPHSPQSLGGLEHQIKIKPFVDSTVWLRPNIFLGKDFKLFDGIHPNDAKQGLLGVCYCLATISTLACDPEQINPIFPFHDLNLGFYVLRFFISGKPHYVVLDDYFPCNASSFQPLFSKPIGKQVWVLLIEKAWAKLIGSYYAAQLMTPDQFMEDLTGYPTLGAFFHKKKQPVKDIIQCCNLGYPIVVTSSGKRMEGIVSSHAYSLMKVYSLKDCRIYRLRNPWGRFEWNGLYGQQSALWTPDLKIKCQWVEGDDGIFFLSEAQFLQAFEYYSIGFQQLGFNYSYLQFTSKYREDKYFKFHHQGGKMSIRVSQPFKRMIQNTNYKYSGLLFEVGRIEDDKVIYISEGNQKCFHGEKSVYACNQILTQYAAGDYFVRLRVEWAKQEEYNSAVISVYSSKKVQINELQQKQGCELWKKLLMSFAKSKPLLKLNDYLDYSMNWMKGQMICYSQIRKQSKLQNAKVQWSFSSQQMKNCKIFLGKANDSSLLIEVDKNHGNFGVIDRLSIAKSCSSGKVSIKIIKE